MATDYFSKWIEAKPLARIQESDIQNFVWHNIICRFGLPYEIVTYNGKKFIVQSLVSFCQEAGIKLSPSTPYRSLDNS